MKKEQDNVFFVNINSPIEIHRAILESSKNVLSNLKRYESFKEVRKYKIEYFLQLKHVMGELNLLINRLRRELPKTGLRAAAKRVVPGPKIERKTKPNKTEVVKPKTSLDRLEVELDDIEAKLRSIE